MLQKVWIKDVRNLSDLLFDLNQKQHCYIYGGNNQGKTSILEAIYLASKQYSPIQSDISKIISEKKKECLIGLDFSNQTKQRIYARFTKDGKKDIRINNKKETTKQAKKRAMIYISADALHLFQKEPDYRRKHLDAFCIQYYTDYEPLLRAYEKCLKQKNKYLKQENPLEDILKTYNQTLVDLAEKLVTFRQEAIKNIQTQLNKDPFLFENQQIAITYLFKNLPEGQNSSYKEKLLKRLQTDAFKEKILGYTLAGPHRDDFEVVVDQKKAFDYYSRGINRSLAILFQLAQVNLLSSTSEFSYLLLDDTFSEIDHENTQALIKKISQNNQIIYATTTKQEYTYFTDACCYHIKQGQLTNETS